MLLVALAACGHGEPTPPRPPSDRAPLSRAADAQLVAIPAGRYVAGSTPEERQVAYDDYLATAGHDAAREHGWFDVEEDRHVEELPAYRLDLMPVTNAQYAEYVAETGATAPAVDRATWEGLGLEQPWEQVERFVWREGAPPPEREDHPVVLVSHDEAAAYCAWRGTIVGEPRRLPSAAEHEKAARGAEGLTYPWGQVWDRSKLNSRVDGPVDTVPVGSFAEARSPFGVLDLAGNVYQWTSTPWPPDAGEASKERTVKGSAWDDYAGVGRGASRHGRPRALRHVIIGFRCAADGAPR